MGIVDPRGYTRLIEAIVRLYRATQHTAGAAATMLGGAAEFLAGFDAGRAGASAATHKPVRRHLAAAMLAARSGPLAELADAFMAVESISDWRQNPNYTPDATARAFSRTMAMSELVGPRPADPER